MKLTKLLKESSISSRLAGLVGEQKRTTDQNKFVQCFQDDTFRYVCQSYIQKKRVGPSNFTYDGPFDRLDGLFWEARRDNSDISKLVADFYKVPEKNLDWMRSFVKNGNNKDFLAEKNVDGKTWADAFKEWEKAWIDVKYNVTKYTQIFKKNISMVKSISGKKTEQAVKMIAKFAKEAKGVDLLTGKEYNWYEPSWADEKNIYAEIEKYDGQVKIRGGKDAYFYIDNGKCTGYQL